MKNEQRTPRLIDWLLSSLVPSQYHEEFFGDLYELYLERLESKGKTLAWFFYCLDGLHLVKGFMTTRSLQPGPAPLVTRSMLKIAWRNAVKHKQFTLLNVVGLTLGIATSMIIGIYVYDEMTYDRFHEKASRIYRVNQPMIWDNWDEQFASTGPNVAIALREDAHEFEEITRILATGLQTMRVEDGKGSLSVFHESSAFAADDNFFKVFSFDVIDGSQADALKEPNTLVLTKKTAIRYFGDDNAVGKTIEIKRDSGWITHTVSAVIADVPTKSHLQFDMLLSMSSYAAQLNFHDWKWIWTAFSTYVLVKEGTNIPALTEKIQAIPPKWAAATTERIFNQSFKDYTRGKPWRLYLQPLENIYLSSQPPSHRFGPTGNPMMVSIFATIAGLVLMLSSINFMNLSTARSSTRAREVGVQKAMGSGRGMLFRQFMIESLFFVLISTIMALVIVQLCLPWFNTLAEKNLSLVAFFANPLFVGVALAFVVILGMLAGSYPALYLSSFKPLETLKGRIGNRIEKVHIRNGLVVFQFTVSIALIIVTLIVRNQLDHSANMNLGFTKNNILQLHNIEQLGEQSTVLRNKLATNPAVVQVAKSFSVPPYVWEGERYKASETSNDILDISNIRVDEDYLPLLGVTFLAGRNFDPRNGADKYGVILNEEAVKALGWGTPDQYATNSPVGKLVVQTAEPVEMFEVIGVVKNFNFNPVKNGIDPLMVIHHQNDKVWNYGLGRSFLSVRLDPAAISNTGQLTTLLDDLKATVASIDPSVQFTYSFLDEQFELTLASERRLGTVLMLFTVLAVSIGCLGLLGLAAFSAQQRKKELGIRKIHGASTSHLMFLFSSEFTRLVAIAIVIAVPIAWYSADKWLNDFANRTKMDPWVFILSGAGALLIAALTISLQSYAAARANPVEVVRNE